MPVAWCFGRPQEGEPLSIHSEQVFESKPGEPSLEASESESKEDFFVPRDPVPLSGMEIRFGSCQVVRSIWVFDEVLDSKLLMESLSKMLDAFPVAAGRIGHSQDPKAKIPEGKIPKYLCVYPNNKGVRFTTVLHKGSSRDAPFMKGLDIDSLLGYGHEEPQDIFCDIPEATAQFAGRDPLVTVKITTFDDRSILGVAMSHAVADACSLYTFVSDWSTLTRKMSSGSAATLPRYEWDRSVVFPIDTEPRKSKAVAKQLKSLVHQHTIRKDWLTRKVLLGRVIPKAMRRMADPSIAPQRLVVYFSNEELENMREMVQAKCQTTVRLSTGSILCAHLAHCISEYCKIATPVALAVPVQMRQVAQQTGKEIKDSEETRVGLAPHNYIGNPLVISSACTDRPPHLLQTAEVASILNDKVQETFRNKQIAEEMKVRDDCIRHNFLYVDATVQSKRVLSFNNYRNIPAYKVDFGGGPAKLCLPGWLGDDVVIFPGPNNEGVLAFLFIDKNAEKTKGMSASEWMRKLHAYTPVSA